MADDRILVFLSSGEYLFTGFDLNTRFDDKMIHLEKWHPLRPVSVVYFEGEKEDWYVKRFLPELVQKPFSFIGEHENSRLGIISTAHHPLVRIRFNRRFKETRDREDEIFDASEFIAIKGIRALGNRLNSLPVTDVQLEPLDEAKEQAAQAAWEAQHDAKAEAPANEKAAPPKEEAASVSTSASVTTAPPLPSSEAAPKEETKKPTSESANDADDAPNGGGIQPTLF